MAPVEEVLGALCASEAVVFAALAVVIGHGASGGWCVLGAGYGRAGGGGIGTLCWRWVMGGDCGGVSLVWSLREREVLPVGL